MPTAPRPRRPLRRLLRAALVPLLLGASGPARPGQDAALEQLGQAQPGLLRQAVDAWRPRLPGRANVYALAVAADGRQALFSREARLALDVAAARWGEAYRGGVLLSNVTADLGHVPLAIQPIQREAAQALGRRVDPREDVAFIYPASHGGRDATLLTDLPDERRFVSLSAPVLARALVAAGVRRRVIVVSACFGGSWIPALRSADTIVVTAARRDRASFGCDDSRALTVFGEAFLKGPLASGASLEETFAVARAAVAREEAAEGLTPASEPQADVGRNMRGFWTARAARP